MARMKQIGKTFGMFFLLILCLSPQAFAAKITGKQGGVHFGRMVEQSESGVKTDDGHSVQTFSYDQIEDISFEPGDILPDSKYLRAEQEVETFKTQVQDLLAAQNFDELEKIAETIRTEKNIFPAGEWKIRVFYQALSDRKKEKFTAEQYKELIAALNKWRMEKPDSLTPKVALISAYKNLAWAYRGAGYGNTVTDMGNLDFKLALQKSYAMFEEAEALAVKDPYLYGSTIFVALGLDQDKESLYALMEKAMAVDPGYYAGYASLATAILPRWGGEPGEVERLADWAAIQTGSEEAYARVAYAVWKYVGDEDFEEFDFNWERVKAGFEEIRKKYPDSFSFLNAYARLACHFKDYPTAAALLGEIGYLWGADSKEIWGSVAKYHEWKAWIGQKIGQFP